MKMNTTRMLALLAAGGLLAATPVLRAQDATTPPAPAHTHGASRLDKLAADLKLTDEQKTKVGAAMDARSKEMKAIHQDTSLSEDDKKAKAKAAAQTYNAAMKSILTPEQYEQWHAAAHHQRPSGGATNAPSSDLPTK
jgi:protein CpxP